jgi:endonuclease G
MDQNSGRSDNFCLKEVTIDEVELRTGLNLMPTLTTTTQNAIERAVGGLSSKLGCN